MSVIVGPCVEHQGYRNPKGYGQRKRGLAHRLAWEAEHGPIPEGLCVLHHCDNPPCVNVDHLFLGTKGDNNQDMVAKGRHRGKWKPLPGEQHPSHKLTYEQVAAIRSDLRSQRTIAADYGVSQSTIRDIRLNRTWASCL